MASLIIAAYLLLVVGLPVGVAILRRFRALPGGALCPHCLTETLWIRSRFWRHARRRGRPLVQRRWCPGCGWEGLSRPGVVPPPRLDPAPTTVGLRKLTLDGCAFRVLIRCRSWGQGWHGRLVFVDTTGAVSAEIVEAFHGSTVADVLSQALALSEHSLAHRLRRALAR